MIQLLLLQEMSVKDLLDSQAETAEMGGMAHPVVQDQQDLQGPQR